MRSRRAGPRGGGTCRRRARPERRSPGRSANSSCSQHETHHRTGGPLKALSHVQSVVERRTTIPILSNVLLRAEAGQLALSATDMDLEIIERVPARSSARAGPPRRRIRSTTSCASCAKAPRSSWRRSGERNAMVLRSGRSTFTLACLPPDDYPVMAAGDLPHNFTLSAAELRSLIDRTRFAISTEETRYYLNGIYLHATKADEVPVIRAVATDGHRLARVEMPAAGRRGRHSRRDRAAQDRARAAQADRRKR